MKWNCMLVCVFGVSVEWVKLLVLVRLLVLVL